jgi:PAS domain S-box-containing protein
MIKDFSESYRELNSRFIHLLDAFSALSALSSLELRNVDETTMLRNSLKGLMQNLDIETCSIFLLKDGKLVNATGLSWDDLVNGEKATAQPLRDSSKLTASIGEGIMGLAAKERALQHCRNCSSDSRFKELPDQEIGSLISVPIFQMGGEVLGVLNISHTKPDSFNEWHERFLSVYCHCLGQLLSNFRLLNHMELEIERRTVRLKQALDETRAAEAGLRMFKTVMDSLQDAVIISDPDGTTIYINQAYARLFGRSLHEAQRIGNRDRYAVESIRIVENEIEPALLRGDSWEGELEGADATGRRFPLWQLSGSVRDSAGKVIFVFSFMRDVTRHKDAENERKKLESQLYQAQKMEAVGLLAGGVAHDFNNIITAITGYAHLLFMRMDADDPLRHFSEQIIASSERAANLTQGLLAFSRKQVINPQPINVNDIIRRVEKLLSRLIGEDIALAAEICDRELYVMADKGQLEQIMINLATNARDAMPDGGELTISTGYEVMTGDFIRTHGFGTPGEYVCISVTDTGIGMDEKTREKIFEPFYTTKEVGKGTGLGLAIVYGIVSQQNGYITVSSGPGEGASFKIYLPAIEARAEEVASNEQVLPVSGTETLLIAEDDDDVRKFDAAILEQFGYRVLTAVDGADALRKFADNKNVIDLAILDVVMPLKNGKEVHDMIQKVSPGARVLFTSGYTADIIYRKGVAQGEFEFIEKPHSPLELLKKVRDVLDRM